MDNVEDYLSHEGSSRLVSLRNTVHGGWPQGSPTDENATVIYQSSPFLAATSRH